MTFMGSQTLHEAGWRQGTVFTATLSPVSFILEAGETHTATMTHTLWVVASQDCDLDSVAADQPLATIEVRPVHRGSHVSDWGIRSRKLWLDSNSYVDTGDPRVLVSPELLSTLASGREPALAEGRTKAFKTWLGLRYDRPAVPPLFVDLAKAIAKAVRDTRPTPLEEACHDVLMQFHLGHPKQFALWAVVVDGIPAEPVAEWLAQASLQIPDSLGILAAEPRVVTKSRLSLDVIENSYAADLSTITWRSESARGAE